MGTVGTRNAAGRGPHRESLDEVKGFLAERGFKEATIADVPGQGDQSLEALYLCCTERSDSLPSLDPVSTKLFKAEGENTSRYRSLDSVEKSDATKDIVWGIHQFDLPVLEPVSKPHGHFFRTSMAIPSSKKAKNILI